MFLRIIIFIILIIKFLTLEEANSSELPLWVNTPSASCSHFELCFIGVGKNRTNAEYNAIKKVSEFFMIKIKSKMISKIKYSSTNNEKKSLKGNTERLIFNSIKSSTENLLQGISVKKIFQGNKNNYVLVSLNKKKTRKSLKDKILRMDKKILVFVNEASRSSIRKASNLLDERKEAVRRYELLDGKNVSKPPSLKELNKKIKDLRKREVNISFSVSEISKEKIIENNIKLILSEMGYTLVKNRTQSDYFLSVNLKYLNEYFEVRGFEKNKFILTIHSYKGEKNIGNIIIKESVIARNFNQSLNYGNEKIILRLKTDFFNLKID